MEQVKTNACKGRYGFLLTAALLAAFFSFVNCAAKPADWETNYDTALAKAQKQNKNLFLIFTGLAWDTVSQTLKTDILDTDEFKASVGKRYVLLQIDVDGNDETIPQEVAMKNYELAVSMGVRSAPTALLVSKAGQPFAFLPMTTETKLPSDLIALIKAESAHAKKVESAYKKLEKTTGMKRVKAIDAYAETIPEQFQMKLSALFAEVLELDPKNTTGLLGKYKLKKAYDQAGPAFQTGDLEGALSSFLVLVDEPNLLSPEEKQDAYYMAAYLSAQSGKVPLEEVLAYLQQAYNAAPNSKKAADIQSLIDSLNTSGNADTAVNEEKAGN